MNILNSILSKIIPSSKADTVAHRPSPLLPNEANAAVGEVDVEEVLREMEMRTSQKLDWQHSIVDLMKLVGMDSSLESRRQLAQELNYAGDSKDTAAMNMWLHEQVMQKLEQNGGKIPASMKH